MLDWRIVDGEEWDAFDLTGATLGAQTVFHRPALGNDNWRRHYLLSLVVILFMVAIAGNRVWYTHQAGTNHIRADIQHAVDLEDWAWASDNEALAGSLLDPQAPESWAGHLRRQQKERQRHVDSDFQPPRVTIQNVELRGHVALVEVMVSRSGGSGIAVPNREMRFYRQGEGRWLRTAPVSGFWGASRVTETEHFRFIFRQRDAAAVEAAAQEVEAMYLALRRDVGLGPPPAGAKLTIELTETALPRYDVDDWRFELEHLTLPSPALLQVPMNLSASEGLTQYIRYPLSERVLDEALERVVVDPTWTFVVEGLYRWLGREGGALPAGQQHDVPSELQQRLAGNSSRLADLMLPEIAPGYWPDRWRSRAAETVIAYGVAAYGRERLPALIDGLGQYESWKMLIPAVFGVPAREFQAGWQAYLAANP